MRNLLLCAVLLASSSGSFAGSSSRIDRDVDALIARMTLQEKVAQLQDSAPAIPRLSIPPYAYWNEALHGVARAGEATVFPQAIGMAATFDKSLLRAEGDAISTEARAKYNQAQASGNRGKYFGLTFWSPNINIFRDPRWGRGQETLGEDPYLTGTLATEFIRGIQGDDPDFYRAVATSKHFAVHSGPEPSRHEFDVDPTPQDLAETYLPAFRRTVVNGHVASIMCAYNSVDHMPACANPMLLDNIARKQWGFQGYFVSDCGAIDDISGGHHFARDNVEGAAAALNAGTDLACVFKNEYLDLARGVQRGLVTEADVNRALHRVLASRMRLGILGSHERTPFASISYAQNHDAVHQSLALRAAHEAIVLLKNDRLLPLRRSPARIAVIGPGATSLISLEGNYNGTPVGAVLPLDALIAEFRQSHVSYAQGSLFADTTSVPVPRSAFVDGVTATFFRGTQLEGQPIATEHYSEIDHNWNWIVPAPGVDPRNFSVRWSALIKAPAPGDYRFELQRRRCDSASAVDRYTIVIQGSAPLHVESACSARDAGESPFVVVHAGDTRPVKLTIEYAHASRDFAPAITFAWRPPAGALEAEALRVASESDLIIAFVGLNAWLEGEEMPVQVPGFAGGDRTDITLPLPQRKLLAQLESSGKPVIIVLQSGSAVPLGTEGRKAAAIIEAWYGGEQGGRAIADVLRGKYNPAGRLPITIYRGNDQLPPFTDYSMRGRTYRYFAGSPEYAFGYGLSYSHFRYSALRVASDWPIRAKDIQVSVRVRNDGTYEGDEVVQLYVTPQDRTDAPARSLKGFERIHLAPGEEKPVTFEVGARDIAFADRQGQLRITPGRYAIWVGGGQPGSGAPGQVAQLHVGEGRDLQP